MQDNQIHINNFSYFFQFTEEHISLLTLENNEFISLGSFKKDKKENIKRLLHLLENNKPTLIFTKKNYIHFLKFMEEAISLEFYSNVFHNYIYSKDGFHLYLIEDDFTVDNYGLYKDYMNNSETIEESEFNLSISYLYFLRYRYLIENFDKEIYKTKYEIFKSKIFNLNKDFIFNNI